VLRVLTAAGRGEAEGQPQRNPAGAVQFSPWPIVQSEEAGAQVDAIGRDRQGHQQADAATDGHDFQNLNVDLGAESARESPCKSSHFAISDRGHETGRTVDR
jgi:hypothetical protein